MRYPVSASFGSFILAGSLLLLAACGGGGGSGSDSDLPPATPSVSDSPWPVDPATVRSRTNAGPPDFLDGDVDRMLDDMADRVNTLLVSDYLSSDDVDARFEVTCAVSACTIGTETLSSTDAIDVLQTLELDHQAVASYRGISLAQSRTRIEVEGSAGVSIDFLSYGGWLEHSLFLSEESVNTGGELDGVVVSRSYSVGHSAFTNPTAGGGGGTWTGVMVGSDVSATENHGNAIQGDAAITIDDFTTPRVDVDFTNVYDLDADRELDDLSWSDMQLSDGRFAKGSVGNSIEGRFYGPLHEEVGGIFEIRQILGSFGATRQ